MENIIGNYYKTEEGFDTILNESGFCAYRIDGDACYIGHIFVDEAARKKGIANNMLNEINDKAKNSGCKYIVGDLFLNKYNNNGYTKKVMVMLVNGFKIIDINDKCLTIMRDIE